MQSATHAKRHQPFSAATTSQAQKNPADFYRPGFSVAHRTAHPDAAGIALTQH